MCFVIPPHRYCDGGSWTGRVTNPPIVAGTPPIKLYFRGRGLFDALFDDLLGTRGLDKATQLLYAGCSAGGLTAYIHADAVTATMKARAPAAKVSRVCIVSSRSSSPLQGLGLDDVISTWFNVIESGCVRTPLPFPSCPHRDVTLRAFWAMPPTPSC